MLKVFNVVNTPDYWADVSAAEAFKNYTKHLLENVMLTEEDIADEGLTIENFVEVKDLDNNFLIIEDFNDCANNRKVTFREVLEIDNKTEPYIFCTTEY